MWTLLVQTARRTATAVLLASSLGTAAFAFNTTVYAERAGCCFWIAECVQGWDCSTPDECSSGFCCLPCPV
jgi:hypothetical protein